MRSFSFCNLKGGIRVCILDVLDVKLSEAASQLELQKQSVTQRGERGGSVGTTHLKSKTLEYDEHSIICRC